MDESRKEYRRNNHNKIENQLKKRTKAENTYRIYLFTSIENAFATKGEASTTKSNAAFQC